MNKKLFIGFSILTFLLGFILGFAYHKFEIFPYEQMRSFYRSTFTAHAIQSDAFSKEESSFYNLWSIGIYEGDNPLDISATTELDNPILSANDVTDIDASYVADPFLVYENDEYFVFFEIYNWESKQGDIGYALSSDGKDWEYKNVVLDEEFHLSYPYIFKWQNEYYMIPESSEDLSVRIYKANSFPDNWEYLGNLISGYRFIDPSIVYHNNMWWLFVASVPDEGVVNLFYSEELLNGWKLHPKNPIILFDKQFARPAGRIISYDDKMYRLAQDGHLEYGQQVFAFDITTITPDSYQEKFISGNPIIAGSGKGWNAAGMHHLDVQYINGKWIGVVDGKRFSELKNSNLPKPH